MVGRMYLQMILYLIHSFLEGSLFYMWWPVNSEIKKKNMQ